LNILLCSGTYQGFDNAVEIIGRDIKLVSIVGGEMPFGEFAVDKDGEVSQDGVTGFEVLLMIFGEVAVVVCANKKEGKS